MIYKAAVIGCGRIGCGFDDDPRRTSIATHAGAYKAFPKVRLVGLADPKLDRLRKYERKFGVAGYTDFRQLLRRERPDLVSICTPVETHERVFRDCIGEGIRGIYCEKPMASSLIKAKKMAALARESKVFVQINHQRRFMRFYHALRDFLKSDRLGEIQHVFFNYMGGVQNNGTHLFDLLRFFFGEVQAIDSRQSNFGCSIPGDEHFDMNLEMKSRVPITIRAFNVPRLVLFEMDILGTQGRMRVDCAKHTADYFQLKQSSQFSEYCEFVPAKNLVNNLSKESPMVEGVKSLVDAFQKKTVSPSSPDDGVKAIELILGAYQSARLKKRIRIPLKED